MYNNYNNNKQNTYDQQQGHYQQEQSYHNNQAQYNQNYYNNNYQPQQQQQYGGYQQYEPHMQQPNQYNHQYQQHHPPQDQHHQMPQIHQPSQAQQPQNQPPSQSHWGESMQQQQITTFLTQYIPVQLNYDNTNYQFNHISQELLAIKNISSQFSYNPEQEMNLLEQISKLSKDQKMQTIQALTNQSGAILGAQPPNLSHLLILLTFSKIPEEQLKKLMASYPISLCKYIEKSFQKCMTPDERVFMENELKSISIRCKEREILFTRDWEVVTTPVLTRESPNTYQKINQIIKDGDQGVIIRVHQQIHQQSVPNEQAGQNQNQNNVDENKNESYSFNFKNQQQPQPNFFQEQKQKNWGLLQNMEQAVGDDLQFVRQQSYGKNSPNYGGSGKKQMLITPSDSFNFNRQDSQKSEDLVTVVGTNQNLEKSYFRLTSAPDPADVRSEEVLMKSLKFISKKWKKQQADYRYIDEQFRSMRQDLTVQRIQNSLSLKIYETHARIALEMADLDQFNQCQTQLHYIYKMKIEGGNYHEFLAYKILYQILCEMEMEVLRTLRKLTTDEKKEEGIIHALKVRKALATGNYGRFFKLYQSAPNMGGFLMAIFIDKHRILCLQKLTFANQNSNLELNRLQNLLFFEEKDELLKFLTGIECVIVDDTHLECKSSIIKLKNAPLKVKRCQK